MGARCSRPLRSTCSSWRRPQLSGVARRRAPARARHSGSRSVAHTNGPSGVDRPTGWGGRRQRFTPAADCAATLVRCRQYRRAVLRPPAIVGEHLDVRPPAVRVLRWRRGTPDQHPLDDSARDDDFRVCFDWSSLCLLAARFLAPRTIPPLSGRTMAMLQYDKCSRCDRRPARSRRRRTSLRSARATERRLQRRDVASAVPNKPRPCITREQQRRRGRGRTPGATATSRDPPPPCRSSAREADMLLFRHHSARRRAACCDRRPGRLRIR